MQVRRVGARLSRAPDVAGCVAIPSYSPADSESAGFLCIAAYVENSLFCRRQHGPVAMSSVHWPGAYLSRCPADAVEHSWVYRLVGGYRVLGGGVRRASSAARAGDTA